MNLSDELLEEVEHHGKDGLEVWRRCRLCGRRGPHDPARLEAELAGRARMAAARRHAGLELDDLDRLALERSAS